MQRFDKKQHLNTRRDLKNQPGEMEEGSKSGLSDLIEACKRSERSAQRRLYDFLSPKMFPLCLRYMGDRDSAEDILQEGFVTLFTKLDSFTGEGSFEGWARKIFVNTALMALRKNDILKQTEDVEEARYISSDAPTAMEDIGYRELMKIIEELPPGFRTVFNMYVIEGYSHKEIGEALGISEVTSRSQLQRARTLLQSKIKEKYQDARKK